LNPNNTISIPRPSLHELAHVLFRWKWTIVLSTGLAVFATAFWLFFVREDLYRTEARLIVKAGQEQAPPSTAVGQPANTVAYRSADVRSEIDILQSTELLGRLIEKYGLDKERSALAPKGFLQAARAKVKGAVRWVKDNFEELMITAGMRERLSRREKTLAGLKTGLKVSVPEGSNTILAELYLPFRVGAGAVLNALLEEYLAFRQKVYQDRGDEFFAEEMKQRASRLAQAESRLNEFERKAAILDQPRQKQILLQSQAELHRLVQEARIRYGEAEKKSGELAQQLTLPRPNYGVLGDFEDAEFQKDLVLDLAKLEKERQQLLLTDKEDSERVRNTDARIRLLGSMLEANLRSVLFQRKARLEMLEAEASGLRSALEKLHESEVEWQDLRRDAAQLGEEYEFYRKKYEESSAARTALERRVGNNVTVIESAIDPVRPSGVGKDIYLTLAFIAGLVAGLAFVALAEFFDPRLYLPSQLEAAAGTPVFAAIEYRAGGLLPFSPPAGSERRRPEN